MLQKANVDFIFLNALSIGTDYCVIQTTTTKKHEQ